MSDMRVEVVTPCPECGQYERHQHDLTGWWFGPLRRVVEPVEVRWCVTHFARSWDERHEFCLLAPGDSDERPCEVVAGLLVIPGETPG